MLRQIEGAAAIANSLTDESTRERVLSAQAHSLLQQLRATVVTGDTVEQITRGIQEAPFTETQKDTLLAALSEKVLPGDGKKPKKSTQELQDIGPFLSEEDVQYLTKTELNNLAKVTRLAEDFKAALKSAAKKIQAPAMHIAKFTTPAALPDEVANRLFSESKPSEMQSGPVGIYGPLRKSHKSITGGTTSVAAPSSFQHAMMGGMMGCMPSMPMMPPVMPMSVHGSPVMSMQQMMSAYAHYLGQQGSKSSLPNLVLFNQGGQQGHENQGFSNQPGQQAMGVQKQLAVGHQKQLAPSATEIVPFTQPQGDPHVQQDQSETKSPMTAAEQADAMLDAWNSRKQHDKNDTENDAPKKPAAAMKKAPQPKAKAKGKATASPKGSAVKKEQAKAMAKGKAPPNHVLKKMPKHERAKYRPMGCSKCRRSPGCTPSCF
eukprot:s9628_g1.t1